MLHRSAALVCLAALLCVAMPAQRARKRSTGPRALALLEVAPNGRARLVPVALLINGRFYDGDLYRADPRPMTLDPETVYEAERSGESIGQFTVTGADSMKGVWIGLGQWRPNAAPEAPKQKSAAEPKAPVESDEPPVLRRPKSGTPEAKPAEQAPAPGSSAPAAAAPAKNPEPAPAKPAATEPTADDPNRPTLRRGKPVEKQAEDEQAPVTASKPGSGQAMANATPTSKPANAKTEKNSGPIEVLTAISDAGGPEPRSFRLPLSPADRAKAEKGVSAMAYAAIQKFASARPQHKPASAAALHVTSLQVYDVSYNNEPVTVLSASLPELLPNGASSGDQYFVTLVARTDMYGELRSLYASVTDTSHLDAYPRLELIDTVDAEGSGTGQLLFRQISDTGYTYALYRVGSDQLWPLFTSAEKSFQ